ncbi:(3R)-hydroxyacyl-ACP dehydratase subunit HadA [Variovorax sp. SRS16]|uniref:MaoC family dehydratase N-terminal domain-containing protein n=1 Tax=Variovorax sp. SRS16 TaxID=282217 RepID=UPI001315F791|nr:MaoC family dehydratase N-terminal domain-containing protein [Variovorax sp. SRS16]VTU26168.1 (3R)-hydroxyacyl-ACP dehydratase subunit HadA [Variovorax sp. SRS16]
MLDRKFIGHALPPSQLTIDRARLLFFAKAIGETSPVYIDLAAARAAGYRDLPAPPTFLFAAEMDSGATMQLCRRIGLPVEKLLHGEQAFTYHQLACAGDTVTVHSHVEDIFDRKGGALEFCVKHSKVLGPQGERVAELRSVLVCRH